jgi:hypothetical protein
VLVTIPPGGAPDISARLIAHQLQETLGWSVVIENRPGANGNIAAEQVVKSPPDGYTLLLHADSGITINPHVYAKLPFDPLKDLVPVASVATNQFMLSLNPKVPANTFQEFIDYARKTTPPLPYASGGNGSQHQLMMEMLKQRAKIELLHVPFRGRRRRPPQPSQATPRCCSLARPARADPIRSAARGRDQQQKRAARFGTADHRRSIRVRGRHLARAVRAGRDAGADRDAAAQVHKLLSDAAFARSSTSRQPRTAGAGPGGVSDADPRRPREVRHPRPAARHQDQLKFNLARSR